MSTSVFEQFCQDCELCLDPETSIKYTSICDLLNRNGNDDGFQFSQSHREFGFDFPSFLKIIDLVLEKRFPKRNAAEAFKLLIYKISKTPLGIIAKV